MYRESTDKEIANTGNVMLIWAQEKGWGWGTKERGIISRGEGEEVWEQGLLIL